MGRKLLALADARLGAPFDGRTALVGRPAPALRRGLAGLQDRDGHRGRGGRRPRAGRAGGRLGHRPRRTSPPATSSCSRSPTSPSCCAGREPSDRALAGGLAGRALRARRVLPRATRRPITSAPPRTPAADVLAPAVARLARLGRVHGGGRRRGRAAASCSPRCTAPTPGSRWSGSTSRRGRPRCPRRSGGTPSRRPPRRRPPCWWPGSCSTSSPARCSRPAPTARCARCTSTTTGRERDGGPAPDDDLAWVRRWWPGPHHAGRPGRGRGPARAGSGPTWCTGWSGDAGWRSRSTTTTTWRPGRGRARWPGTGPDARCRPSPTAGTTSPPTSRSTRSPPPPRRRSCCASTRRWRGSGVRTGRPDPAARSRPPSYLEALRRASRCRAHRPRGARRVRVAAARPRRRREARPGGLGSLTAGGRHRAVGHRAATRWRVLGCSAEPPAGPRLGPRPRPSRWWCSPRPPAAAASPARRPR